MNPEQEATKLLEEVGIMKLPVVPTEICRALDIAYIEKEFRSIEGLLIVKPNGAAVISVNALVKDQGRKHFTCAHELGHLCMDSHIQDRFCCSRSDIEAYDSKMLPMELRANRFAGELLMPQFIYQELVKEREPGWDSIKDLAIMSQTSWTATAMRFMDLTDHACVLIVSEKGLISWFRPSQEFKAYVETGIVPARTIAHTVFQGSLPPDCFEVVKADNWLTGRGVKSHTEILEWTLPIDSYGRVLTLLFDEGGIAGWDKEDELDLYDEDYEVEWEPPTFHKSRRKK